MREGAPSGPFSASRVRISLVGRGYNGRIEERSICSLVLRKWGDYRPALTTATLRFLDGEAYLDAARADPRVCDELSLGVFDDFDAEFREPVLADANRGLVTVCPPMMREIVAPEPPRIQRAYVEGAFLRRMFRLLVAGEGWEADAQVRAVMARHYPFHLAAVEAVERDRGT